MKARVEAGIINIETHWELKPSDKKPSYVKIEQGGEIIAYEQFAPPNSDNKKGGENCEQNYV